MAWICRRLLCQSKSVASFVACPSRFRLGSAAWVSHLPKPVLHVHAQALEWNLLRMVGEELRHRTIGDAATFRKQKFFGNPVLNPCRRDREHISDILDLESAQTLCRVVEIPEPLPDSRDSAA